MKELTVRIVKVGMPTYWYAGKEGKTFEVYDDRRNYIVKEDYDQGHKAIWRHIDKEDVEVVE